MKTRNKRQSPTVSPGFASNVAVSPQQQERLKKYLAAKRPIFQRAVQRSEALGSAANGALAGPVRKVLVHG